MAGARTFESPGKRSVKALDIATGRVFHFSDRYRCAREPSHIHVPPHFTIETAFEMADVTVLGRCDVGDVVFIEWLHDRFYAPDGTGGHVPGPIVWRLSQVQGYAESDD